MFCDVVILNILSYIRLSRKRHCVAYTRSHHVCKKTIPPGRALCGIHGKMFENICKTDSILTALVYITARFKTNKLYIIDK